jgi:hypothetical protein
MPFFRYALEWLRSGIREFCAENRSAEEKFSGSLFRRITRRTTVQAPFFLVFGGAVLCG